MKYLLTIIVIFATITASGCGAQTTQTPKQTHSNPVDKFSPDVPN